MILIIQSFDSVKSWIDSIVSVYSGTIRPISEWLYGNFDVFKEWAQKQKTLMSYATKNFKTSKLRKNEDNRHAKRQNSPRTLNPCFCCPKIAVLNSETASRIAYISFLRVTSQMNIWYTFNICINLVPDRKLKSEQWAEIIFSLFS